MDTPRYDHDGSESDMEIENIDFEMEYTDEEEREYADEEEREYTDEEEREYTDEEEEIEEIDELELNANPVKRGRPRSSAVKERGNQRKNKTVMLSFFKFASCFCCMALCLSTIQTETVVSLQEFFNMLSKSQKSQWILDWLWTHHTISNRDGQFTFTFLIGTTSVCLSAWLAILGVPKSTFYSIRKHFQKGIRVMPKQGRKKGRLSIEALNCITWLQQYAGQYAEKHPDSTNLDLPPCLTRRSVFEIMEEELHNQGLKTVSETYFISTLWKNYCSNVKIPPTSRFSKCDTCVLLKLKLAETISKEQRTKIFEQRRKHLEKQSKERQKYYKHCMKARRDPSKYMSIIIDGMDQQKTHLPNFVLLSKFTSGMWRLRTHLVGTIVHGIGVYGFFDCFQWPHSTNLTLSILVQLFSMLKENLPDTLYLQMDNCARENKNRYVFAFFTWLVEIGIFKKVKINFLMVGHTHEDVDQVFSRFSSWLKRYAAITLQHLMEAFEKCYTPRPIAIQTSHVFDITGWIENCIEKIEGHSKPHCFKITKTRDGETTKLYYKNWSTDKVWVDATKNFQLLKDMPSGQPLLIQPHYDDVDITRVQESIEKCIRKQFIAREEDISWWRNFFTNINTDEMIHTDETWPITDILNNKTQISESVEEQIDDVTEDADPVLVTVGKKQKQTKENHVVEVGKLVLVNVPKYAGEWPQIGMIQAVGSTKATIHWYKGSKTTTWTSCTKPVKGQKGKREDWLEDIDKSFILKVIKLTPSGHLTKTLKDELEMIEH